MIFLIEGEEKGRSPPDRGGGFGKEARDLDGLGSCFSRGGASLFVLMKRWARGDWDGFFALGLDNLIMLLLMSSVCLGPLGFSPAFFFGQVLPANAVKQLLE
ncbi:MAG: hypothetical protein AAGJ31_06170 [Verrucomicrobiota bacterium]